MHVVQEKVAVGRHESGGADKEKTVGEKKRLIKAKIRTYETSHQPQEMVRLHSRYDDIRLVE